MKSIFSTLLVLVAGALPMAAQNDKAAPTGFVRMVDGLAQGTGSLSLIIDGENMRPKGYNLGDATGGIALSAGSHKVTMKREGVKEGSTTVSLAKDQTVTLIPFAERVPASDSEPAHFKIQILRLKQKQVDSGRTATFVSVSANPQVKVELGAEDGSWASAFVKRLAISELPLKFSQGYAPMKVEGVEAPRIPIGSAGNYVVVLYDDLENKVQALYFRDFKFLTAD